MEKEVKNVVAIRKVDRETGRTLIYLKDENWGPVIEAATMEEATELFKKALKACGIINSIFNIQAMFDNDSLGRNKVRAIIDANTSIVSKIEQSLECA